MYYKSFQGLRLSALGLGGLRFPTLPGNPNQIDRTAAQAVVDAAFAAGINYIDTAYNYQNGDSERFLGAALAKYPRDSYYLATKFCASISQDIEAVFRIQQRRLKTDYFDFYLLHSLDENNCDAYMDRQRDYLGFLRRQQAAGHIGRIGFSSHAAPRTLEKFLDYDDGYDMALIQLNYLDWSLLDARGQYELLTKHRIPVWVMEPLKGGRLTTLNPQAAAMLRSAAPERSLPEWSFRFLMGLPNVQLVLSGMSSPEQVRENAKSFSAPSALSPSERAVLDAAAAVFLQDLGVPCSGCRYCCPTCPAELDIPLLLQSYNERRVSGETWRLGSLLHAKGPSACLQCGACRRLCPQKIDIPAILRTLAESEANGKD